MASAALATQNEPSWAQSGGGGGGGGGGGYMGKIPSAYMNPNPNPKKKQKQFHNNHQQFHGLNGRDEAVCVTQTASDDAYSFNQRPNFEGLNSGSAARNGFNMGGCLTFNLASYKKAELVDLRKKLVAELEQVRSLRDRIDSGQFSSTNNSQHPRVKGGKNSKIPKNLKKLPVSKRPVPFGSDKDLKKMGNGVENRSVSLAGMVNIEGLMKECRSILTKLMKHKDGWVFNVPVDDVALGLHDYHQIVKRPMDLGTVKSNFGKKLYNSPVEFADDVRLTFNNALLYNPKQDPVNSMAEGLLVRFEELFKPIQDKIDGFRGVFRGGDDVQHHIPSPERVKKTKANLVVPVAPPRTTSMKKLDRVQSQSHSSASTPSHPPPPPLDPPSSMPSQSPSPPSKSQNPPERLTATGRPAFAKLPKPRAKDPNKREMNIEEKHKLGLGLQSLPQEKMPQLVQIIKKRNEHLAQDGDEIELDIEALDTETLWELDRFVTNWKKMVSKAKRQALLMNLTPGNAAAPSTSAADTDAGPELSERNEYEKKPKKGDDLDDDDVDIEEDMPVTSFPPVEIEKDEAGGGRAGGHEENGGIAGSDSSSSSSSGSGSSSSSDSDSGSSSGSDSDEDEAQS